GGGQVVERVGEFRLLGSLAARVELERSTVVALGVLMAALLGQRIGAPAQIRGQLEALVIAQRDCSTSVKLGRLGVATREREAGEVVKVLGAERDAALIM